MILNVRAVSGADEAAADGLRFDHARVIDAAVLFAEVLVSQLAAAHPHGKREYRLPNVQGRGAWQPYDPAAFRDALHERFLIDDGHLDVSGEKVLLHAAPFNARFYLKGGEWLIENSRGEIKQPDGSPGNHLEPTPLVIIVREDDYAVHDDAERRQLTKIFTGFQRQHGLRFDTAPDGLVQAVPALWFDHAAFGNGSGPIRIRLQRTP